MLLIDKIKAAYDSFTSDPTIRNAHVLDALQREHSHEGLVDEAGDRINPPGHLWPHRTHWETFPIRKADIAKPDNGADATITIQISGNRLVALLNGFDRLLYEAIPDRVEREARYESYIRDIETLRDILSDERWKARK